MVDSSFESDSELSLSQHSITEGVSLDLTQHEVESYAPSIKISQSTDLEYSVIDVILLHRTTSYIPCS